MLYLIASYLLSLSEAPLSEAKVFSLLKGSFAVEISTKSFAKERNKISSPDGTVVKINGKTPYGTDGGVPNEEIQYIKIRWKNGAWSRCPKSLFDDCFNLWLENSVDRRAKLYLHENNKTLQLRIFGSDAAGSYVVSWFYSRATSKWKRCVRLRSESFP